MSPLSPRSNSPHSPHSSHSPIPSDMEDRDPTPRELLQKIDKIQVATERLVTNAIQNKNRLDQHQDRIAVLEAQVGRMPQPAPLAVQPAPANVNPQIGGVAQQVFLTPAEMLQEEREYAELCQMMELMEMAPPPPLVARIAPPNANPLMNPVALQAQQAQLRSDVIFQQQLIAQEWDVFTEYNVDEGFYQRVAVKGAEKVIIGYYDGKGWNTRRWAFASLSSGWVPTFKGTKVESWWSTWLRNHERSLIASPFTGIRYGSTSCGSTMSGDEGIYATTVDKKGHKYILIPANGQALPLNDQHNLSSGEREFTGYVPAREVLESLKTGYLSNPDAYKLIADKNKNLNLACKSNTINYRAHGFELHGKIWWPKKNGNFADFSAQMRAQEARIDQTVQKYFNPV